MVDLRGNFPSPDKGSDDSENATLLDRIAGGELRDITLNMAQIDTIVAEFESLSDDHKSKVFRYMLLNSNAMQRKLNGNVNDALTGFLSPDESRQQIGTQIARLQAETHGQDDKSILDRTHLVYFDMDGLKQINDNLGHAAGDEAFRRLGESMRAHFGPDQIIGRLGGDEFFMIVEGDLSSEEICEIVRTSIHDIVLWDKGDTAKPYPVSASIGTSNFSIISDSVGLSTSEIMGDILSTADLFMYVDKKATKEERLEALRQRAQNGDSQSEIVTPPIPPFGNQPT